MAYENGNKNYSTDFDTSYFSFAQNARLAYSAQQMSTAGNVARFADLRKFDIEKQLKSNIVLIFALVEDIMDGKRVSTYTTWRAWAAPIRRNLQCNLTKRKCPLALLRKVLQLSFNLARD